MELLSHSKLACKGQQIQSAFNECSGYKFQAPTAKGKKKVLVDLTQKLHQDLEVCADLPQTYKDFEELYAEYPGFMFPTLSVASDYAANEYAMEIQLNNGLSAIKIENSVSDNDVQDLFTNESKVMEAFKSIRAIDRPVVEEKKDEGCSSYAFVNLSILIFF